MDAKVTAVLEVYEARSKEEHRRREAGDLPPGWLDTMLLSVGPDSGRLLNVLARSLKAPRILELGTSYGYSTIWLAEAARAAGGRVTTMELQGYKQDYARDMATRAGLAEVIDFQTGDAVELIGALPAGIDLVLVDLWKDLYVPCLEAFLPKLAPGALIVADNMIFPPGDDARRYRDAVRSKPGITTVLLPVGSGLELSRWDP